MAIFTNIPFALDPEKLMAEFRIDTASRDAVEFAALINLARSSGRPKAAYTESYIQARNSDTIRIDQVLFTSRALVRNVVKAERVFPVLATCGIEMDEAFMEKDDPLQTYWWDGIKTHLLETATQYLFEQVRSRHHLSATSTMWPGSGDAEVWPIEQQRELFVLLAVAKTEIGITLTDSFLMVPNKSVSGILFPTERDFRTCELCHRSECPSRQAPFNEAMWQDMHMES